MPQAANELLIEKGYVDALNLKADIGDTISVYYRNQASRQLETADFQIISRTKFCETMALYATLFLSFSAAV